MIERTVLASFYSREEAELAARQIKHLGVDITAVDQLHAFTGFIPEKQSFPLSGNTPSLASLTLNVMPQSQSAGILMAADPAASGMTDGQDLNMGRNFLLTVVCKDEQVERVVQVIKNNCGYT